MRYETPLHKRHEEWARAQADAYQARMEDVDRPGAATASRSGSFEVTYLPYGPEDAGESASCQLVASYGPVEPEYAAIRRKAGLLDAPHRGTIEITGPDRLEFLDRMITQSVSSLPVGAVTRSFWLDRKGRIVSDLLVGNLEDRTVLEMDIHACQPTAESLEGFHFAEDLEIVFTPEASSHVMIHGPAALALVASLLGDLDPAGIASAMDGSIDGCPVTLLRSDDTGEPGFVMKCKRSDLERVWDALLAWEGPGGKPARPIGWAAYNTARIEGGTPLFNIDFGTEALPNETGLLKERVDFKKGCYLGQEIVARIDSLGQPKQLLRGVVLENDMLPVAGSQVFRALPGQDGGDMLIGPQAGWVTSSTIAPMAGAHPVAFVMLKHEHAEPGTDLILTAEGTELNATVQEKLQFLGGSR